MTVKIEKEVLADGKSVRWRARGVSTGRDPQTGKRRQRTVTGKTKGEVEREVRRIGAAVDKGVYVRPWNGDVNEMLDAWLGPATRGKEENTRVCYTLALRLPRERLGHRRALSITKADVDQLVDFALAEGRARGGRPGTGLSVTTVRAMLARLSSAFQAAVDDDKLPRNPCRLVKVPAKVSEGPQAPHSTWSEDQVRRFITASSADRLAAAWLLSLLGLRRGEVCGLRWSDISLSEGTLSIRTTRVTVSGSVHEKGPKSRRGYRTLPLFQPVAGALEQLYRVQLAEAKAAGAAYAGTVDEGFVAADELGAPIHPKAWSYEFGQLCKAAGLPRIRLHDARHTVNSLLEHLGVSPSIRAHWLGHTVTVNTGVYTHAADADLAAVSTALTGLFTAA